MKICFDHILGFGKIEHIDLIFSEPYGIIEPKDDKDSLLNEGWIPWNDKWYNVRSVRINIDNYKPTTKVRKKHKEISSYFYPISNIDDEIVSQVREVYLNRNRFTDRISLHSIKTNCTHYFQFEHQGEIKGFTFCKVFDKSLISFQFYQNFTTKLSLGSISQHYECLMAKDLNKQYVYLLSGYETSCKYKSNYYGMEWWTGQEWSTDYNLYNELCDRDSVIEVKNYENIRTN